MFKVFENDTMTPLERIDRISYLKDTDRVGFNLGFDEHAMIAGKITPKEFYYEGEKAALANLRTYLEYGAKDFSGVMFHAAYLLPIYPDPHSRFFFEWNMPTKTENRLPQMIETKRFESYSDLIENGFMKYAIFNKQLLRDLPVLLEYRKFLKKVAPLSESEFFKNAYEYSISLIIHPTDAISILRGLKDYLSDVRRQPEELKEACDFFAPGFTELGLGVGKLAKSTLPKNKKNKPFILYGASRIGSSWISPRQFEDIFFDSFKKQIHTIVKAGFRPLMHLDNDYTLMLEHFKEIVPKHSGAILHMDTTDIYKAKEILGDYMALMGNLPPSLMVLGSPNEVEKKCKEFIMNIGDGGGYILSNACNLPINTAPENIFAVKKAVEKYGYYKN
ncbi:MAG: uroporphyrinogen decarboxylase family protein [Candidatus Helarchaeota archaeon]